MKVIINIPDEDARELYIIVDNDKKETIRAESFELVDGHDYILNPTTGMGWDISEVTE